MLESQNNKCCDREWGQIIQTIGRGIRRGSHQGIHDETLRTIRSTIYTTTLDDEWLRGETSTQWYGVSKQLSTQFSWWVLQHCTGFARLVWGRLRVHRAFVYSDCQLASKRPGICPGICLQKFTKNVQKRNRGPAPGTSYGSVYAVAKYLAAMVLAHSDRIQSRETQQNSTGWNVLAQIRRNC